MAQAAPARRGVPGRGLVGWLCWSGFLLAAVAGGHLLGQGALAPPALTDPGSWAAWAGARSPLEASFAVLGLVVVVLAWYLLVVTTLAAAARLWGGRHLVSVVDVVTLPIVRRSLSAALGVGLVGSSVAGTAAGGPVRALPVVAIAAEQAAVSAAVPGQDTDTTRVPGDGEEVGDAPVMHLLPGEVAPDAEGPAPAATPTGDPMVTEWEVRPGDHLWSLAVQVLADAFARAGAGAPGEAEVVAYWQGLIEANLDRLADPANPDLIFPGQVLVLPAASPSEPAPP